MKKIISILAFVALLAGCKDLYGPTPEPKDPVASKGVEIVVSDIQDSSFVAVITPKEEGVYFSYVLRQEDSVSVLDPEAVLALSAEGAVSCTVTTNDSTTVAGKPAKATFKAASAKLQFSGLKPNTKYVVYATAASKTGIPCDVVSAKASTSDALAPKVLDFDFQENEVALLFSETVSCPDSDAVWSTVYSKNYLTESPVAAKKAGKVTKIEGTTAGTVVYIKFKDITTPGSYYTVNFPEGTFVDGAGNKCAELKSKITSEIGEDGKFGYSGVVGYLKNGELQVKLPKMPKSIYAEDYADSTFIVSVPNGVTRVDLKEGYVTIVKYKDESSSTVTEYPMEKRTHYWGDYYSANVKFAGVPVVDGEVSIKIPAGAIMDWYGNVNSKDIVLGPVTILAEPLNLNLSPESTSNRATLYVEPNKQDVRWVCFSGTKESPLPEDDAALVQEINETIAYYAEKDKISFAEALDKYFAYYGGDEVSEFNLSKGTEVEFAAYYIDADGTPLSDVFRTTVKTSETFTAPGSGNVMYVVNSKFAGMAELNPYTITTIEKKDDVTYVVKGAWGGSKDLEIKMIDDSGNCFVSPCPMGIVTPDGPVYIEEIYTWNGSWSQNSFYDSILEMFFLTIVYYDAGGYYAYGTQSEIVRYIDDATAAKKASALKTSAPSSAKQAFTPYSTKFIVDKQARRNHLR